MYYLKSLFLLSISISLAFVSCQISNDLDTGDLEKTIQEKIPGLENFNKSAVPTQEDAVKKIKEKCEENGGPGAYAFFEEKQADLKQYIESNFNLTSIQSELDEAGKTGSMDEVFGRYCDKYPEISKYLEGIQNATLPCLTEEERPTAQRAFNVSGKLVDFVCFKRGDRIAMFIAEGGIECLKSQEEELKLCANKTIGDKIPQDFNPETISMPLFILKEEHKQDYDDFVGCFKEKLEKCEATTPANVAEAFFKYTRKLIFPPDNVQKQDDSVGASKTSTGVTNFIATSFLFVTTALVRLM